MGFSESYWIGIAGLSAAALGAMAWYAKSILLTSRCTDVACCCMRWTNQPVSDAQLVEVLAREGTAPQLVAPRASYDGASYGQHMRTIPESSA